MIFAIRKLFFLFLFCIPVLAVHGQEFPPKPSRLVNDYTNTLSGDEINRLKQKLVSFDDSTSTQIAVVIIASLEGNDVADYASRLAEAWGVGQAQKNNGIIVLVALNDRKVTIQTGYGVEGALPDAIARRIIENEITPGFKAGDYYAGLDKGTDAIISYTKGEYKSEAAPKSRKKSKNGSPAGIIIFIIIAIIVLISRIGGGGGGNQVIGRRGGASPFWWMLMGSALSGRGGGGFSGGGGGFSGGGGGFGGFGGGSFGGGGASGSW